MIVYILVSLRPAVQTSLNTENQEIALTPTVCMQLGYQYLGVVLVTEPAVRFDVCCNYMPKDGLRFRQRAVRWVNFGIDVLRRRANEHAASKHRWPSRESCQTLIGLPSAPDTLLKGLMA